MWSHPPLNFSFILHIQPTSFLADQSPRTLTDSFASILALILPHTYVSLHTQTLLFLFPPHKTVNLVWTAWKENLLWRIVCVCVCVCVCVIRYYTYMHLHVHLCAFLTNFFDTSDKTITPRTFPGSALCVLTMKRRQRRYFRTLQLTHQMLSPLIRGVDRCFLQEEDAPLLSRTSVYSWRETFLTSFFKVPTLYLPLPRY